MEELSQEYEFEKTGEEFQSREYAYESGILSCMEELSQEYESEKSMEEYKLEYEFEKRMELFREDYQFCSACQTAPCQLLDQA